MSAFGLATAISELWLSLARFEARESISGLVAEQSLRPVMTLQGFRVEDVCKNMNLRLWLP